MIIAVIPNDILLGICAYWLQTCEVISIDTAVCSKEHRDRILENWKCGIISIDCYDIVGFWSWISLKQVRLTKLSFYPNQIVWESVDVSKIHTVTTCNDNNSHNDDVVHYTDEIDAFVELINRCMELRTLDLDGFVSILQIKPCVLEHLTSLESYVDTIEEFHFIAKSCKNLVTIELYPSNVFTTNNNDFLILFVNNPKMREFKLKKYTVEYVFKVNSNDVLALTTYCPELCDLVLNVNCDGLVEDQFLTIIASSKQHWNYINITAKRLATFQLAHNGVRFDSCRGFSSTGLTLFFQKFNNLADITFVRMTVCDSILYEISLNKFIECIMLNNCSNDYTAVGLKRVLGNCSRLTVLVMDCHSEFVVDSLSSYNSSGLQKLLLYNVFDACTLDNIISILSNHSKLKELTVLNCKRLLALELEYYAKQKRTEVRIVVGPRRN